MTNIIKALKKEKLNGWILYFMFLGIIQALWTNPSSFPPLPFRLLMTVGVFIPIIFRRDLALFVFPFFIILRGQLSTAYQYLPDVYSYSFYILLIIVAIIFHAKSIGRLDVKSILPLLLFCIYVVFVDVFVTMGIGKYAINVFIAILLFLFVENEKDIHILSAALITVCTLLAVYYIIMYDTFLETWDITEKIERSGWNDPNYFSTLLGMGFMIAVLYILDYLRSELFVFNKKILISSCIILFAAIVMTASRAGFLSVSLITLFAILKSRPKFTTIILSTLIIVSAIIILYRVGVFDTLIYRMFEQGNLDTGGDRTTIWAKVFENFQLQPFHNQLFGGGYWHRAALTGGAETHNEIVAILADYGFIGTILFLFLILSMFSFGGMYSGSRNIATVFYLLCIVSLSPFQYINIGFLIIWILGLKRIENTSSNSTQ